MEPSSEVIWRNHALLENHRVLLVNAPADELGTRLNPLTEQLGFSSSDFAQYRQLALQNMEAQFELLPSFDSSSSEFDRVVLFLPREKERLRMTLHWLASAMPESARLWLVGENRAGAKSAVRQLEPYFAASRKLDSARRCSLFEVTSPQPAEPFDLSDWYRPWKVEYQGVEADMLSLPGVFAHGRLDAGSRLLLDALGTLPIRGRLLDFAAGSGVLGIAVALTRPNCELTLLDVSKAALCSAEASMRNNGIEAQLCASDGTSELEGRFDWIISNPPFHRGVKQTLDVTQKFFADAGTFLAENGKIVIVCNRHLPYAEQIRKHFRQVDRLTMNNEFTVLQASSPV